jgi:hypothetical protein
VELGDIVLIPPGVAHMQVEKEGGTLVKEGRSRRKKILTTSLGEILGILSFCFHSHQNSLCSEPTPKMHQRWMSSQENQDKIT